MLDPIGLMVVGRILERALIASGGILALWLGFRLFALSSSERSSAELSGHGFAFKAERIGPGVFFALFGAVLLSYSTMSQINIKSDLELEDILSRNDSNPLQASSKQRIEIAGFGDAQKEDVPLALKATNTLISIWERNRGDVKLTGADYQRFKEAAPALREFQRSYIDASFEPGTFDTITAIQEQCAQNTQTCRSFLDNRAQSELYSNVLSMLGETIQ